MLVPLKRQSSIWFIGDSLVDGERNDFRGRLAGLAFCWESSGLVIGRFSGVFVRAVEKEAVGTLFFI